MNILRHDPEIEADHRRFRAISLDIQAMHLQFARGHSFSDDETICYEKLVNEYMDLNVKHGFLL